MCEWLLMGPQRVIYSVCVGDPQDPVGAKKMEKVLLTRTRFSQQDFNPGREEGLWKNHEVTSFTPKKFIVRTRVR